MTTLFDTTSMAFDQYLMLVFPGAALLVTAIVALRGGRRKWLLMLGGLTIFLFLLTFCLPVADYHHVQAAARAATVRTVEGVISNHSRRTERRFAGFSRGVGVTTSTSYTNVTIESFHVGQSWFAFEVGEFPSHASFTNIGDPPIPLRDGQRVLASYFEDPWYDRQARITKLVMLDAKGTPLAAARAASSGGSATSGSVGSGDAAFDAFWTRFSRAAAAGDMAGVGALTRFPFLFAGTPLDAARFETIWAGIFPAPLRPCFETAEPVKDGAAMSVSCGAYVYVFEKGKAGWQLTGFTADPEGEG